MTTLAPSASPTRQASRASLHLRREERSEKALLVGLESVSIGSLEPFLFESSFSAVFQPDQSEDDEDAAVRGATSALA